MLDRIRKFTALAKKVWEIVSFILSFLPAIRRIVEWVESIWKEAGENGDGETKRELAMKVIMELYDIIDDVIDEEEESIPIGREKFKEHAGRLVDIVVYILNTLNIFS